MNTTLKTPAFVLAAGLSLAAHAFDAGMAEHIDKTATGQMDRQFFVTKPCKVEAADVLQMLAKGDKVTLLDMRT